MTRKNKFLFAVLLLALIGVIILSISNQLNSNHQLSYLQIENEELSDVIHELKNEREEIESEKNDLIIKLTDMKQIIIQQNSKDLEQEKMIFEGDIEYNFLRKYGLTKFIVPEEQFETFDLGQMWVKYRVNSAWDYCQILQAKKDDYFMKYVFLLNKVYDGNGMNHFYE